MNKTKGEAPSYKLMVRQSDGGFRYEEYQTIHAIAGDTDSSYLTLDKVFYPNQGVDSVVNYANNIGTRVNDTFPEFMAEVFNVNDDRMKTEGANVIQTDRETVSDKSLFKATKMYMMHIVDKEGERVDEEKITGLDIRKTDTAKVIQNFLTQLCRALMDDQPFEEVQQMIDVFEQEFKSMSFQQVGRPMTAKALKPYQDAYHSTGDLKSVPYHIKASIYYNSLCGANDLKIRAGDKISVVPITNGTLANHIAVPVDANRLPDFVNEFKIDRKESWRAASEKIRKYLVAVGWDRQSRQEASTQNFVEF